MQKELIISTSPQETKLAILEDDELVEFYIERRVWVPIAELQDTTREAFVAAEDRRFFHHPGVDVLGISRMPPT